MADKNYTEALARAIERIERHGEKRSTVSVFLSPDLVLRSSATVDLSEVPTRRIVGAYAGWRFGYREERLREDVIQTLKELGITADL